MDLLDVPLEAALRLYSLPGAAAGATGLAWAWAAAFLAAVLGLWGIRAVGSKTDASPLSLSPSAAAAAPPPPSPSLGPVAPPAPAPPTGRRSGEASATKARYTAYYRSGPPDDCCVAEDERDIDDEEEEDSGGRYVGERRVVMAKWGGECRREGQTAAARRRWDLGWYRFLDMTALDGSVVRLWDGGDGGLTAQELLTESRMNI